MSQKKPLLPHHLAHSFVLKGDEVMIIAGKDKGQKGRVERVLPRKSKVVVAGHNIAKRHIRATQAGQPSGVIEKPMPLHASNVMVICSECGQPTRIAYERVPQGVDQKVRVRRICKKCEKPILDQSRTVRG